MFYVCLNLDPSQWIEEQCCITLLRTLNVKTVR